MHARLITQDDEMYLRVETNRLLAAIRIKILICADACTNRESTFVESVAWVGLWVVDQAAAFPLQDRRTVPPLPSRFKGKVSNSLDRLAAVGSISERPFAGGNGSKREADY
jgi:hypothetical protein